MKKIILYGASNFGDEIAQLFRDITKHETSQINKWEIYGFLDDDQNKTGVVRNDIPVIGTTQWLDNNSIQEYFFVCCIGNPRTKELITKRIKERGGKFGIGIHPSVIKSDYVSIGEGTIITAGNILTTNIEVGSHVIVNLACTIGHYSKIHDYCTINPGANISGDVTLEEGVLLGTNCTILEKMTIGKYSVIGAGAVVNKNIPDNVTAVGIPAKVIKIGN